MKTSSALRVKNGHFKQQYDVGLRFFISKVFLLIPEHCKYLHVQNSISLKFFILMYTKDLANITMVIFQFLTTALVPYYDLFTFGFVADTVDV